MGFPGGSAGKEFACNVGDLGSIPGLGRSPEGGQGQRSLAGYTVHGVAESRTQLRDLACVLCN